MKNLFFTGIFILIFFCGYSQNLSPENIEPKILVSEFIYETADFPSCHASTLVETKNGILAGWFGGTHERNKDVCIYTSENVDGKWSNPQLVADGIINDTLRHPCWNPVLYKRNNGDIILYYKVGPSPREWWGEYKISADEGKTWSDASKIPNDLLGPIKNKPVTLPGGKILYPTSFETPEHWNIYVETSDQNLGNWQKVEIDNNGFNAIQPTILSYKKGRIQLLCRSQEKKIVESWSDDFGKTWSPVTATKLVNNNSGIDAVTLKNGLQLLVCNPLENGRNKLVLKSSVDGINWFDVQILEDQPRGEFSYPAIIQNEDETVHITYTYNREKIKYIHLKIDEK